jgi:hypothetical protein
MIDLNIKAVHTLTKLFLKDFVKKDKGYILNVSSSAAFFPGPLMSSYYATKSYVLRLGEGINKELKTIDSNVYVGTLCPGPVDTNFNKVAGVHFNTKALTPEFVAKYAIDKMFNGKKIIIPGLKMKLACFIPVAIDKITINFAYNIQKRKV